MGLVKKHQVKKPRITAKLTGLKLYLSRTQKTALDRWIDSLLVGMVSVPFCFDETLEPHWLTAIKRRECSVVPIKKFRFVPIKKLASPVLPNITFYSSRV